MARPRFHVLATMPVAWGAYRRWGGAAALGLTLAGIFVDLDHLADYAWMRVHRHRQHFLAPLHAWELVAAGAALVFWARRGRHAERSWMERATGGLVAGLAFHLVQDVLTNRPRHAGVYALTYRLRHRFDRDRIGWEKHEAFHAWTNKPWYTWL
jgi:hypothetical protein